jgi:hypothetical protein
LDVPQTAQLTVRGLNRRSGVAIIELVRVAVDRRGRVSAGESDLAGRAET